MLKTIPFLKLTLALSVGIILSTFFELDVKLWLICISFICLVLFHRLALKQQAFIPLFSSVFLLFIIILGLYRTSQTKDIAKYSIKNSDSTVVLGKIAKEPKVFDRFIRTQLDIINVKYGEEIEPSQSKSLLMVEKDSTALALNKGDHIIFKSNFKNIDAQTNPEAFNYKRYLFFKLISQKVYLNPNQWQKLYVKQPWYHISRLSNFRQFLLQKFKSHNIKGDELSVLSALTLGYKNDLDYCLQKSYVSSGAIHVLTVSGLHVGIVFFIVSKIFSFLGKSRKSRILRFILVIISIWFFALLTGGAPSVLRASLMFSFMAFGQMLTRKSSIYNSIFASAFFLLLFSPFLLFNLSFQLSYSAVISIVYFQPKISLWFNPNSQLIKKIWDLTSVSLAAQIATFPITIFYFHQFPNYFLLSNFIVIPLAGVIIWLSLIFFVLIFIPPIASYIAYLIKYIIKLQNFLIQEIESWPISVSKDLYIDKIQLSLLILIILTLMFLSSRIKFRTSLLLGLFILCFSVYSQWNLIEKHRQKKLVVFDVKGETAINLINGRNHILISTIDKDSKQKDFNMAEYWLSLGLKKEILFSIQNLNWAPMFNNSYCSVNNGFIQFLNQRILYIQDLNFMEQFLPQKLNIDYIIIGKNTKIDVTKLKLYFNFKEIVIDASHDKKSINFWKKQKALNPNSRIHIIAEQGAFIKDLI